MNQNVLYPNQANVATAANPPQLHFCFKCRWEARTTMPVCPRCGRGLFSQTNVRWRGVALTFLGLFLSGFMSVIAVFVTAFLVQTANEPRNSANFKGTEWMLILTYLIFGGVIGMGVTMIFNGLWQIIFGRRNMVLIWIFFALMFVTFCAGTIFRGIAG